MTDISMCANKTCEARKRCHRHECSGTAPSRWQSYSDWGVCAATPDCPGFWPKFPDSAPPKGGDHE